MRTSTVSVRGTRPSPWHVGHTFLRRPLPSQRGHVRLNFIAPAICVTVPLPSHSGQTVVPLPALPLPPQVSQTSCRATLSLIWAPRIASQNPMLSPYSRSLPFSGARVCSCARPPPKNWLKISRHPPPPKPPAASPPRAPR